VFHSKTKSHFGRRKFRLCCTRIVSTAMANGEVPVNAVADCYNSVRQRLVGSSDSLYSSKDAMTGLIIYVRTKPSSDTEFVQVLLPVALSYETFVCKLCVAFGVQRDMVKKVVKLPDILIRTTEDVIRLTPFEKLEIVLHRSMLKHAIRNQWKAAKPWCSLWWWTMLLVFSFTAAVSSNNLLKRFDEITKIVDATNNRVKNAGRQIRKFESSARPKKSVW